MSTKFLRTLARFRKQGYVFQIPSEDGTQVENVHYAWRLRSRIKNWDRWEIRVVAPSGEVVKTFKK